MKTKSLLWKIDPRRGDFCTERNTTYKTSYNYLIIVFTKVLERVESAGAVEK